MCILAGIGTPGAPTANCEISGGSIIPTGRFSFRWTLEFAGQDTITSVNLDAASDEFTVTKVSDLVWDISLNFGENVFTNEMLRFVKYDENFEPSFHDVNSVDFQPEGSSIVRYTVPNPRSRTGIFDFLVEFTYGEDPLAIPPVASIPETEIVSITQSFLWSSTIGLGQLEAAIENSRY